MTLSQEIAQKRRLLRAEYGGLMSTTDLIHELGFSSRGATLKAARDLDIPSTLISGRRRYDTDIVAQRLVERRGMS